MRLLKLLLVMLVCAAGPAVAGPFEDGLAAYARGDYAKAASWFRKAADHGDAAAPYYLGFMYEKGQGVPQDYAAAEAWYRKGAERGDTTARGKLRDPPAKAPPALPRPTPSPPPQRSGSDSSVQMKKEGGTYKVPVLINNVITLDFTVDSGASDVSIPEDVVSTLIRAGTIKSTDFIDEQTYTLADGSKLKSHTFRIRSLKVGDRVLENVTGSVAPAKGSLLLGQSFLGRFKSWSIDNGKHVLVLE
jgi:clan AA aspartic protease (TIGR02281 family)